MGTVFYSNKEEIRNRIIKKAQEHWGIHKVYDFDPLVLLIMEVLSTEIFNINNEVVSLEQRIYDKISRILASDYLVAPHPSHGILLYQPNEEEVLVKPTLHMNYKKKLASTKSQKGDSMVEMSFSSLEEHRLFPGKIKYMATTRQLYEVHPNFKKPIGKSTQLHPGHYLYLGVSCFGKNRSRAYSGLNFYFDWGNYSVEKDIYRLLNLARWTMNGHGVEHYQNRFLSNSHFADEGLFGRKNLLRTLIQDVEAFYEHKYFSLGDDLDGESLNRKGHLPLELEQLFDEQVKRNIETDLDWIKIEMPAAIAPNLLEELHVQLNAIPVVNKRAVEGKHRLKVLKNVIPIETGDLEQLLTVEEVLDKHGVSYSEVPYTESVVQGDVGFYTVRYGGVERLDKRSAKDVIDYLFELIRDEKAAFSGYNTDFLNTVIRDLDKNLSLVQQKSRIQSSEKKGQKQYIIINPKHESDLVFTKLWLTHAELANGISVGSPLQVQVNAPKNFEQLVFLTNTRGGRSRLGRNERSQAFKYGLITADRIVSKNDIINFVRLEFGNRIKHIDIKNGVAMNPDLKKGFYKTLDIYIDPVNYGDLSELEWQDMVDRCLDRLKVRSNFESNYRIRLNR